MNAAALAHPAPTLERVGPGARQMDAGTMRAWDREWKRAEVAAWFRGTPPAPEQRSPNDGNQAPDPVDASPDATRPSFVTNRAPFASGMRPTGGFQVETGAVSRPVSAGAFAKVGDALPVGVLLQSRGLHATGKVDTPAFAMPAQAAPPRTPPDSQPGAAHVPRVMKPVHPEPPRAVHVHIERAADGVRVWLGIPASGHGPTLGADALIGGLRRSLAAQGYRLTSVICNGEEQP